MRRLRVRVGRFAATLCLVSTLLVLRSADVVRADLNSYWWWNAGVTISSGQQSNQAGFWQALGRGQTAAFCVSGGSGYWFDGIYGNLSIWHRAIMLNELAGTSLPGTSVGSSEWQAIQLAFDPIGAARFTVDPGYVATQAGFYTYYDGYTGNELYYQGGSGLWKFRITGLTGWYNATSTRTMGSFYAC